MHSPKIKYTTAELLKLKPKADVTKMDTDICNCSQLNVQVQWCMTVGFGDQSAKAEKS